MIKTNRVSLLTFVLLLCSSCSHATLVNDLRSPANDSKCELSQSDRDALLKLDYQSFDQTLPDGGWRKYENQGCLEITRDLIDAYTAQHESMLLKWQKDVLIWHSGQISGMLNDYPGAIVRMEKTLRDEKPTDTFLWNPYAKATIAFLKKDKGELLSERKKLARGTYPTNHVNVRVIDSLIRCFDSPYKEAYSRACEPKETNIDRIKSLSIKFDFKNPFPLGIQQYFQQKKLILIGEQHGTKEMPEIFGKIATSVADVKTKTLVALEIPTTSQASIDQFLKTGDETILGKDPFFTRDFQDGRSSKAMVKLLKHLATLPNTTVLCMDTQDGAQQARDTGMAKYIHSKMDGFDNTLVYSGNVHSSVVPGFPWDKTLRPMGYELKAMLSGVRDDQLLNILIRTEKLNAWNCMGTKVKDCSAKHGTSKPTDYSSAVNWKTYFIQEDKIADGHIGSIFIRSTKVSFPLIKE